MTARVEEVLKQRSVPYKKHVSSAALSTFRIGGVADLLVEPLCAEELIFAVETCRKAGIPHFILGRGSNVLFDDNMAGTVLISTRRLDALRDTADGFSAECGVTLASLFQAALARGLGGLSFAAGIPGSVGGAVLMNAGAFQKSIGDTVKSVLAYDLERAKKETLFHNQLNFSYRNSIFQAKNALILRVELVLEPNADKGTILEEAKHFSAMRRATQPLEFPSAGSAFRRREAGEPLSKILDELGLRGMCVGGAAVSEKHAGFIINKGDASAADVKALIAKIQNITERERGFKPIPEIRFFPTGL